MVSGDGVGVVPLAQPSVFAAEGPLPASRPSPRAVPRLTRTLAWRAAEAFLGAVAGSPPQQQWSSTLDGGAGDDTAGPADTAKENRCAATNGSMVSLVAAADALLHATSGGGGVHAESLPAVRRQPSARTQHAANVLAAVGSTRAPPASVSLTARPVAPSRVPSLMERSMEVEVEVASADGEAAGEEETVVLAVEAEGEAAATTHGRAADGAGDCGAGTGVGAASLVTARIASFQASRDAEIARLDGTVRELRSLVEEQGRILQEQNTMLAAIYAAGAAAATKLAEARAVAA